MQGMLCVHNELMGNLGKGDPMNIRAKIFSDRVNFQCEHSHFPVHMEERLLNDLLTMSLFVEILY